VVNVPRWVTNVTDAAGNVASIFGQQRAQIFDANLRASVAASRRLSFDLFTQLLVGSIHYSDYSILINPRVLEPYPYDTDASYDRVSLTVNAVARYEYLPGSFVTLVFLHRQSTSAGPADLGFNTGAGLLNQAPSDTMIMAKVTYLFF
jgi:hypothetical protein